MEVLAEVEALVAGENLAPVENEYPEGVVTIASLSFDLRRMLVVRGRAVGSPDLRICRAQLEVEVPDAREVLRKWQGFHWVYVYGDYTRELEMLAELKGFFPNSRSLGAGA